MSNSTVHWLLATIFVLSLTSGALAQEETAPVPEETPATAPTTETTAATEKAAAADTQDDALAKKVSALEELIKAQNAQVTDLNNQVQEMQEKQAAHEELEDTEIFEEEEVDFNRLLNIYGFFDVKFHKAFQEEDSVYYNFINANNSFVTTSANLYFASQMTENWGALLELKFAFVPFGQVSNTGLYVNEFDDQNLEAGKVDGNYEREGITARDSTTSFEWRQGGMNIERVHLTYTPFDWLNVIAGRFLTPFGIWNVDHGSPVIIPVAMPYFMIREMVPLGQTGLQIYGRLYPADNVFFDYAFTVSNGRGPTDQVYDLDENKGFGLKLKGSFEGDNLTVALGGYGYFGKSTDARRATVIYTQPGTFALDTSRNQPIEYREYIQRSFDEWILTGDFLIETFGLALQSEIVWRKVKYDELNPTSDRGQEETLFAGADPTATTLYPANFIGLGYYFLLSYDIPRLKEIIGLKVRPYVMYEDNTADETTPYTNFKLVTAGLNLKPNGYVTLKAEYLHGFPESDLFGEDLQMMSIQAAVSF